jgi:large subunit ribosomal protein L9
MQVILIQHMHKLGRVGDLVNVSSGYARNYLLPTGKAKSATKFNLADFKNKQAEYESNAAKLYAEAEEKANKIKDKTFTIYVMSSDEGKLYGSITSKEICEHINNESETNLRRDEVITQAKGIQSVGDYEITIQLEAGIVFIVNLKVARQSKKS